MSDSSTASYSQILKASSIIGGTQGIKLLLGMLQVKFAAVLVGPVGLGLLENFVAVQAVIGAIAGLGIQSSAVRDVAQAAGQGDPEAIGRTVLSLRRICWLTGLLGAVVIAALSPYLSQWTFGSDDYVSELALLGLAIVFGNLAGGQTALLQGVRRIGDLARLNIIGAAAGTVIAIGCYAGLGRQGIVPALLGAAGVQFAAAWYFARRVPVPEVVMSWRASLCAVGGMVRLGLALMWSGLVVSLVAYLTRALITQQFGLEAVGIYGAAFLLSGTFVNVVLGAMAVDYYPRLIAAVADQGAVNRLVNEQTEIGLLLGVPGLLATLSLAPWIIRLLYTDAFLPAADLLQWFVLGCLGRVISWPLGFVLLALGKSNWYLGSETLANAFHFGLIVLGLATLGIEGVAIAFFLLYLGYTAGMYLVARHLTGFGWSEASRRLFLWLLPLVAISFGAARWLPLWPATGVGVAVVAVAAVLCLRGLVQRIGIGCSLVQAACRVPAMRWILNVKGGSNERAE